MIIKLIVNPNEGITTTVVETIIESLTRQGLEVEVLTEELYVNKDVELRVTDKKGE